MSSKSISRNEVRAAVQEILEHALETSDTDGDPDYWCDDCSDEYSEGDHHDDCECECHDEQGYIQSCASRIAFYVATNFAIPDSQ